MPPVAPAAAPGRLGARLRAGLALKLAVCLVISAGAFFAIFGYVNLRLQRSHFEEMVVQNADRLSDLILRSTRHDMLRNDREALYHLIRDVGSEAGIRRVRIFNEEGRIRFSTDASEVDALVDKRAEACYTCHAQKQPLQKLSRPNRARTFREPDGTRTLAVIRPIYNQPDCSNAACHAHPPDRRVLGVIDAHISLANVDAQLAEHKTQIVGFTAGGIILVSLLSVVFVWVVVHRPIKDLMAGIHKVAEGNLDHRLSVHSRDELGELAESFNKMTAELAQAHAELTDWARTLEQRVESKTEELSRAHKVLVNSEKMASLGKLAATVAHEVNNPLFGMLTYARLTLKYLDPLQIEPKLKSDMQENLRVIERESRRCGEIMKNLLTFARQAPPARAPNNLNTLVERALSLIRHQLELQSITLEKSIAPELPEVSCDAGQIQQVLLVLLVNAVEIMGNGGTLYVTTSPDAARRRVRIIVRDSGPGISPDVLPQIFEPFFTTKENQHRTGLGLAIAKNIVDHHAGTIQVRSTPGEGAEFIVELPVDAKSAQGPVPPGPNTNGEKK